MTIENVLDMFYANENCQVFHDALCAAANAFQEEIINYYYEQEVCGTTIEIYEDVNELEVFRKYAKEYGLIDED